MEKNEWNGQVISQAFLLFLVKNNLTYLSDACIALKVFEMIQGKKLQTHLLLYIFGCFVTNTIF